MSENNLNMDENDIHYVYGDQEYVLNKDEIDQNSIREFICSDGSHAILLDGQYIVADNQAILLQDDDTNLTQFYINEGEESPLFDDTECVQLVQEDTDGVQQIIYYTNEDSNPETPVVDEDVEGIQDEDGNIYPFKRIKLEGQLLNFEEFVQQQAGFGDQQSDQGSMEYTFHEEGAITEDDGEERPDTQIVDISKITGRNLITGQTVTLHSYMERLKKRLNKSTTSQTRRRSSKKAKKTELSDLLDKKISIGTTKSGKKIVGKIIHVEKKNSTQDEEEVEESITAAKEDEEPPKTEDPKRILIKKSTASKESFEHISKTLGGVMEMESVRKKLENKNIVVKLIEKKYVAESDSFSKNVSYSYGFMEQEFGQSTSGAITDKWKFVPDQDTQNVILGDEKKPGKFPITTSLTILMAYEKAGNKTIRVNLNPAPGNMCTVCAQCFKSNLQLRHHMDQVHNTYGNNTTCEICEKSFDDAQALQEHRNEHVQEGNLFICPKCNKCFGTQAKLQKHLPMHDIFLRPLECSVCEVRCSSEWALKKHLLTHTGIKPFSCDICSKQFITQYDVNFHKKVHFPEKHFTCNVCMRTFSRHANLLRHTEIHKGTGALYKCEICYCSYNYISSLTRHMVQNHIDTGDCRKKSEV